MTRRSLRAVREVFPIRGVFRISRGARTESVVVTATISEDGARGRGECVPYPRYGESVDSVLAQIEGARGAIEAGAGRADSSIRTWQCPSRFSASRRASM